MVENTFLIFSNLLFLNGELVKPNILIQENLNINFTECIGSPVNFVEHCHALMHLVYSFSEQTNIGVAQFYSNISGRHDFKVKNKTKKHFLQIWQKITKNCVLQITNSLDFLCKILKLWIISSKLDVTRGKLSISIVIFLQQILKTNLYY